MTRLELTNVIKLFVVGPRTLALSVREDDMHWAVWCAVHEALCAGKDDGAAFAAGCKAAEAFR